MVLGTCLQVRYLGLIEQLKQLVVNPVLALSAAVYTELSDVEAEINGLTTYDRKVCLVHGEVEVLLKAVQQKSHGIKEAQLFCAEILRFST